MRVEEPEEGDGCGPQKEEEEFDVAESVIFELVNQDL
jgi:hypothetical protein